jgi:ABC-type Fe3+-hydroxamate transport system substrate-binding protein
MRVLVCGGRGYSDIERLYEVLDGIHKLTPVTCIIEGGAKGADYLACRWSAWRGLNNHRRFNADWELYGSSAGPRRNLRMIEEGKPDLVVAFPGGRGTADMVAKAEAAGIPVQRVK